MQHTEPGSNNPATLNRNKQTNADSNDKYSLEIVTAHLLVKPIPPHTLEAPVRKILAWVIVLAGTLAVRKRRISIYQSESR